MNIDTTLILPLVLAAIGIAWPEIQRLWRGRAMKDLTLRELSEIAPYPENQAAQAGWWEHQKKQFVHRKIFENPGEHLDFLLSIDPNLVYFVTLAWKSLEDHDWVQWKYALESLSKRYDNDLKKFGRRGEIGGACKKWELIYSSYQAQEQIKAQIASSASITPLTTQVPECYDYLAPDGSEIRLLLDGKGGGMAHCTLPSNGVSTPLEHRTVEEIWYFLEGQGKVWWAKDGFEEVVDVHPGVNLSIPTGTQFQFKNTGNEPLCFLITTMPPWPGEGEAIRLEKGGWQVS